MTPRRAFPTIALLIPLMLLTPPVQAKACVSSMTSASRYRRFRTRRLRSTTRAELSRRRRTGRFRNTSAKWRWRA